MINQEEALQLTEPGWYKLINTVYGICDIIPFARIIGITKYHSMLRIQFESVLDKHQQYMLDCIAYKIERDSVRVCERCAARGVRRSEIPTNPCLCTVCFTLQYNELMESTPSLTANHTPQL
jgi:hypothetical protein